jgi:AmiR/NasT family two-component response regulator
MESLRILIADDESIRLLSLRAQLAALGHIVVAEASNGEEAVVLAASTQPDLAIILALIRFRQFQALRREVADLREALEARKLIERAKGILMRRLDLSEDEAFQRLQRQSQNTNRRLAQVAEAIIMADQML